ncbi:putative AAA+ ATPase domain, ATPase, AAA-type, core, AAA-type ATPase domain-containing protein [Helianthus annuus]|nr:putative AAA+ ATPase domain, ATPase, AAA-type, core, AAA-type ATPase domain-containing protein [Helianthus annuus]
MASSSNGDTKTTHKVVTTIGSVAAVAMVARTILIDYCPPEVRDYLYSGLRDFLDKFSTDMTMVIEEFFGFGQNEHFTAAQTYLLACISSNLQCVKIGKNHGDTNTTMSLETSKSFTDTFKGVKMKWFLASKKTPMTRVYYNEDDSGSSSRSDQGSFELTFHRKHKDMVLKEYLPFIMNVARAVKQEEKTVKLSTVDMSRWKSVNFDHPATFDTLAIEPNVKAMVKNDLDMFLESRDFYRKIGKAWKRGYLLYGPPGTGKSSMIAAIANYLKFDVYDLELTAVQSNSELRRLLLATANRSLLVVEDIDCSIELHDRAEEGSVSNRHKVTLSGFLNFIDGLWSSCGDQRIIIFTTNHKEKLDPALLRPGRMDVHINMSYCTVSGFRLMASNYLGVSNHDAFEKIEHLIGGSLEITPAEVGEQLLRFRDPDVALGGLLQYMDLKKKQEISEDLQFMD